MKRLAALALFGSFPLVALAGPVSVYPPPKPAAPPTSLNQPLSSAVQTAASNLPAAPAPTMTSNPSWGSPAVYPGTTVPTGGAAPCGATPCVAAQCGDPATCQPVRPYFNLLAPRAGCDTARGSCLDQLKAWICYRSTPGGPGCSPVPYQASMRAYFPCRPDAGCAGGNCGTGGNCATGRGLPVIGGGNCGTVSMPVSRLSANDCPAPACRPRVLFIPLTRSECPTAGCDTRPVRPRLLDRLLGLFNRTPAGAACDNVWCSPNDWKTQAPDQPVMAPAPTLTNPPMTPPSPMPPTGTKPIYYTPQGGKTSQLPSQQPFTNP